MRARPTVLRIRPERLLLAAKMRAGRAVLGWSQTQLGKKANLTQRAIYRLEKGATQARQKTELQIERAAIAARGTAETGQKRICALF
jgi:DNA-binding XRE family transcriptional regulator